MTILNVFNYYFNAKSCSYVDEKSLNKCSDRSMGSEQFDRLTDWLANQPTDEQTDIRVLDKENHNKQVL